MYIGSTGAAGPASPRLRGRRQLDRRGAGRATATRSTSRIHIDDSVTVVDNGRGIPVDMHDQRAVGGRSRADGAARRRQVRQRQLQGVGRPARRRRLGRQRAVGEARARDLAQRPGLPADATSAARRWPISRSPARPKKRGTKITFKPDPQIFETTEFSFDTLAQRLRELAFLNGGVTITLEDERDGKSARVPLRGRHRRVRRVPQPEQGAGQRQADLHARREGRHRRRDRAAVERRLRRDGLLVRQQHQHASKAARTCPASARR